MTDELFVQGRKGSIVWVDPVDPDVIAVEFEDGTVEETRRSYHECHRCGVNVEQLHKCEACKRDTCYECLVGVLPPPHPFIDYNLCWSCFERGGED